MCCFFGGGWGGRHILCRMFITKTWWTTKLKKDKNISHAHTQTGTHPVLITGTSAPIYCPWLFFNAQHWLSILSHSSRRRNNTAPFCYRKSCKMKMERAYERLSESAVLFSESICKCFQLQSRLWFLILLAVGKFLTLFSGFKNTCMPGFHKVCYILEISTVKKIR